MKITTAQSNGDTVLKIEGDLRIGSVADAKPELVALLAAGSEIRIDLGAVDRCDTAGVQLLLMTCASARAKGKKFVTISHSAALLAALDRAGIPAALLELE